MSPSFSLTLSIWSRTLLFHIVLVAIYAFYELEFIAIFGLVFFSGAAFLMTFPLLIVINRLVKWMSVISYSPRSRLASLGFMLVMVGLGFYILLGILIGYATGMEILLDQEFHQLAAVTTISVILSCWSLKGSFYKLNPEKHEEQLG